MFQKRKRTRLIIEKIFILNNAKKIMYWKGKTKILSLLIFSTIIRLIKSLYPPNGFPPQFTLIDEEQKYYLDKDYYLNFKEMRDIDSTLRATIINSYPKFIEIFNSKTSKTHIAFNRVNFLELYG